MGAGSDIIARLRLHIALSARSLTHTRAASYFLVEMSIVEYELKAARRDYGTKYDALDDNGWT